MNRNILGFCICMCVCASLPLCAQPSSSGKIAEQEKGVRVSSATSEKDYRIETERDGSGAPAKYKLMSPKDKVVRVFSPEESMVSKSGIYLLYNSTTVNKEMETGGGYVEKEKVLYNAKGEKQWEKKYRSYPASWDPEVGDPGWGMEVMSDDGKTVCFNFRDEQGKYCVAAYSVAGNELAKGCLYTGLDKVEISPDGKIIGAVTYLPAEDRNIKHLFFLEVDTGKTKLVMAENDAGFGEGVPYAQKKVNEGYEFIPGNMTLYWNYSSGRRTEIKIVKFDSLPNDIYQLFPDGGKR